jgi:hypothetical protein
MLCLGMIGRRVHTDIALHHLSDAMYPTNFHIIFGGVSSLCVHFLTQNSMFLHTSLFMTEAYADSAQGRPYGASASRHLAKALPLLQKNLEDRTAVTAYTTIGTIVMLTMIADLMGDVDVARKHIQGLHRIVTIRGGIDKLGNGQIQVKCCRSVFNSLKDLHTQTILTTLVHQH